MSDDNSIQGVGTRGVGVGAGAQNLEQELENPPPQSSTFHSRPQVDFSEGPRLVFETFDALGEATDAMQEVRYPQNPFVNVAVGTGLEVGGREFERWLRQEHGVTLNLPEGTYAKTGVMLAELLQDHLGQ